VPKDAAPTVPNEIASLDGTNADQETKSSAAKPEAEEDLLLTDDQDRELDPTEVLGAGLGEKEAVVHRRPAKRTLSVASLGQTWEDHRS
jgi:hypothetical protein